MIGKTLDGRYHILSLLGTGRCGKTYLAKDELAKGRPRCVIKQFEPEAKDTLSLRKAKYLFAREVKILKILGQSDRIPDLLGYFHQEEKFYLVHQFIEGTDLAQELGCDWQWTAPQVLALLKEILEIVEVAHVEKVIHQDIKPSNIIRRQCDRKLMLIDFGSIKKIHNQMANLQGNTSLTVPIGTLGYMAPEQRSMRPRLASDIYSVGMIGIYALTGVEPQNIPIEHDSETVQWHSLSKVESRLAKILDPMVSPDFGRRYASAAEALKTLRDFKLGSKGLSLKTILAAATLLLTAGGISYYYWQLETSLTPEISNVEGDLTQSPFIYRNDANGVEMKYPADWKLVKPMARQRTIAKFTPEKDTAYAIAPVVNLEVIPTSEKLLEKYTNNAIYKIKRLPRVQIINSLPTKFAGAAGHKIVYTVANSDSNLQHKYLQIWTIKGDRAYIATYQAAIDNYADFAQTVEDEMFSTLTINSES
jgi:serine/threonine-protein kinase